MRDVIEGSLIPRFQGWPWKAAVAALCITALAGCDSRVTSKSDAKTARPGVHDKTLGYVLSNTYDIARFQDDKVECPEGFRYSNRQNWEAQFPTQAARQYYGSGQLMYARKLMASEQR